MSIIEPDTTTESRSEPLDHSVTEDRCESSRSDLSNAVEQLNMSQNSVDMHSDKDRPFIEESSIKKSHSQNYDAKSDVQNACDEEEINEDEMAKKETSIEGDCESDLQQNLNDTSDISDTDKVRGTLSLLKDLIDVTSKTQPCTPGSKNQSLEQEICENFDASHTASTESVHEGQRVTSISDQCESECDKIQSYPNLNHGEVAKINNELTREKENSPRNVFDTFHINQSPHDKSSDETATLQLSGTENANVCCINAAIQKAKEVETDTSSTLNANDTGNTSNYITESHDSLCVEIFEKDMEYQKIEDKHLHADSDKEMSETDINKKVERIGAKNNSLSVAQERDGLQESDILKKAKEKYNLKELRVSLNTDEVKDCGEVTSLSVQSEKSSNFKVPKSKQTNENFTREKTKKDGKDKNSHEEKIQRKVDYEELEVNQSKSLDHVQDSDSAKPLKKRGRRGYDDTQGSDKTENSQVCDLEMHDKQLQENKQGLKHLDPMPGGYETEKTISDTVMEKETSKQTGKVEAKRIKKGKDRKIKAGKRKDHDSVKFNKSKIETGRSDGVKYPGTITSDSFNTEKIESEPSASTNSSPIDIPNVLQLKKYPGRSCKLRNQLPLVQFKPKKSKTSIKSKSCDHNDESKLKSNSADSPLKVKKKRKRKVKPWSWGNEKKKYKPKPKNVDEKGIEKNSENKAIIAGSYIDSEISANEQYSEENKARNTPVHSKPNSEPNLLISNSISEDKNSDNENLNEQPQSVSNTLINLSSCESTCHEETQARRDSKGRPKKKGKRGRKPKCVPANEPTCLNESTGSSHSHEIRASDLPGNCVHLKEDCNVSKSNFVSLPNSNIENHSEVSVLQSTETSGNLVNDDCADKCTSEQLHSVSDNQQTNKSSHDINLNNSVEKVQKGKRGRPRKGEGKERSKKRKTEPTRKLLNAQEERTGNVAACEPNAGQADINDGPNVVEHVDNEIPVDNYPHVSPDSGIQSLAGSPAGNESPNSVIMNVENSGNSASVSDNKHLSDLGSNDKESEGTCDILGSDLDSLPVSETKDSAGCLSCSSELSLDHSAVGTSAAADSDNEKNTKDQASKNNITDNSKEPREITSNSPSKKKNRAKFLQLHKTSTLLQKGRLPTEEEKEKRLDDKFDYPEPTDDKRSSSPPIDLYSQHMKSFQVTHGICDGAENSQEQEFVDEYVKSVKKGSVKALKKSHSKHKVKRKSSVNNNQSSIFEKMSELQGKVESLLSSHHCTQSVVVSSSFSAISDYSPVYHSSSVLTPVTSTVTTFATTDTISTYSTVVKPIISVSETVSIPSSGADESFMKADNQKEQTSDAASESAVNHVKNSVQEVLSVNHGFEADNSMKEIEASSLTTEKEVLPLKKKRGRPPSKKKGVIAVKHKILNKVKNIVSSPPLKTLNAEVVKRNRGRPKGSKNKKKKLLETVTKDFQSEKHLDLVRKKTDVITVNEDKLKEKTKRNKVNDDSFVKTLPLTENDKVQSFSNNMMEWRESSVLGKEEKKKRGPGRPRKYPLVPKTPVQKPDSVESVRKDTDKKAIDLKNYNDSITGGTEICTIDQAQVSQTFTEDELVLLDDSLKQLPKIRKSKLHPMLKRGKKGKKKGTKVKKSSEKIIETVENEVTSIETEDICNITDLQPARSVSSHDSDTSGAGSSFGTRSFQVQMWMEMSKQKRKKNRQKLRYFRSKHKNIIDPVFIAKVDCLVDDFPQLSISPPGETYLKVRPGEVPLPSIFKIVRINIKKKKKDRLFVFEKAKPLKPKNELESGPKDKIKVGRKIGDHLMDLTDISEHQQYNLPPKKRHKLFSGIGPDGSFSSAETNPKPEKRKAGRPKKVRPPSQDQGTPFSFGKYSHFH